MSEQVNAPTSPAQQYADYRAGRRHPVLKDFASRLPFGLDDFQRRACEQIEDGLGVLVAAPTGSGKTIVGEFSIHLALATGRKCFYTTPIKALSNQKYHDLVGVYGPDRVGLLTGDHSVNGEASVVVMTTEVLRNMLYARSHTLSGLGFVVMDEVHYLADRSRGAVWEEVIIHLPESVTVVSLSATVSNAEEFGDWLATARGETATIVEEKRPVPLFQHVMVGKRLLDLFADTDEQTTAGFVQEGAEVNRELMRIARDDWASSRVRDRRAPRGSGPRGRRPVGNGRRVWLPSRVDVIDRLDRDDLLPAICFIFSRAGCDAAVEQCVAANLRLTSSDERDEIFAFVEQRCADLQRDELDVLGYHEFLDALTRGVAAHHAGMLPVFKECVESLFQRGLCKVVFATETLALGINMPARTVVIEKLSKWNGDEHADLTPGEFTQLTGRAGRRGLDVEGHAVVLWQQGMNPKDVAGLASTRTYPLRSSFRPSYNMAVNLVAQYGKERAREILELSFAQFQADKAVVGLARQLRKAENALDGYAESATCHLGDFMEYAGLRERISQAEKSAARSRKADRRGDVIDSLLALRPGDVIIVPAGKFAGYAVVVEPVSVRDEPRPMVVTAGRQARRLSLADFPTPVTAVTRMRVPRSFNGRNPQMRRDLASSLQAATHGLQPPPGGRGGRDRSRRESGDDGASAEVAELRRAVTQHPCHRCPDREDHARWAERWFKLDRDARTLKRRVEQRTNTVARTFDRVCEVLLELGYLARGDEAGTLRVTEQGDHLKGLYAELDLVAAEALRRGVWRDLDPAELAGALSALVYEARRADESAPRVPSSGAQQAIEQTMVIWAELEEMERRHKVEVLRRPDAGLAWGAYRWAGGDDLDEILTGTGLSAGDFVRRMRQLIDFTTQVAGSAGDSGIRKVARHTADALRRGVVAQASLEE